MKIEHTTGCLVGSHIEVDGVSYYDMNEEEREQVLNAVFTKIRNSEDIRLDDLLCLIEADDCEWSDPCEQCGDSIVTTKWTI